MNFAPLMDLDPTGLLESVKGMSFEQFIQTVVFIFFVSGGLWVYQRQRIIMRKVNAASKVAETKAEAEAETDRTYAGTLDKVTTVAVTSQQALNRIAESHEAAIKSVVESINRNTERLNTVAGVSQELVLAVGENMAQQDTVNQIVLDQPQVTRKLVDASLQTQFSPLLERVIAIERTLTTLSELIAGSEEVPAVRQVIDRLDRRTADLYEQILNLIAGKELNHEEITRIVPDADPDVLHGIEPAVTVTGDGPGQSTVNGSGGSSSDSGSNPGPGSPGHSEH